METDLYGKEMSSVRPGADERVKTKADQSSCSDPLMQEMERKNKIHSFSLRAPGEVISQPSSKSGQLCGRCCVPPLIVNKIKA